MKILARKAGIVLLALILVFNLSACGSPKATRYEAEFLGLFDTLTKIVAYTQNKDEFTRYSKLIHDNLKTYHELYDIYNDYEGINNIKTINDNAGIAPVKVDRRIIDLIRFSKEWYVKTNGSMNIALGAVLRIWHDYREAGIDDPEHAELPPMELLRAAAGHTDIDKVIINEAESTVYLEDPEMSLDVGGVGKGYAVEQVCRIAEENGFTSGLISVGGNVRAIGGKEVSNKISPWNVGIQNPDTSSEKTDLYIINLTDASLVTSGIYERYYTVGGRNYHHIIDPTTLYPSDYFASVTIICKDSGVADALAKIINMPYEQGLELIESMPDTEALWVLKSGEMKYSTHFMDYVKK